MDGLWAMVMTENEERFWGAGVLAVNGSKIQGGDTGYFWVGELTELDGGVEGTIDVRRYIRDAQCIFPELQGVEQYSMKVAGGYHPERFWATATVVGRPDLNVTVQLVRVA